MLIYPIYKDTIQSVRFTFIQPASFVTEWRRLGLSEDDLRSLENEIMERPDAGKMMAGTGGLRKMRFAPPSRHIGKSGAMRVGYFWLVELAQIYLLVIFPKNEKENLSVAERKYFSKWIEYIRWHAEHEDQ
jgi:hypothetical protein